MPWNMQSHSSNQHPQTSCIRLRSLAVASPSAALSLCQQLIDNRMVSHLFSAVLRTASFRSSNCCGSSSEPGRRVNHYRISLLAASSLHIVFWKAIQDHPDTHQLASNSLPRVDVRLSCQCARRSTAESDAARLHSKSGRGSTLWPAHLQGFCIFDSCRLFLQCLHVGKIFGPCSVGCIHAAASKLGSRSMDTPLAGQRAHSSWEPCLRTAANPTNISQHLQPMSTLQL